MPGPLLYSANPWFAHDISTRYLSGRYFVWCSEYFDSATAPAGSASAAIAPSSMPAGIYSRLKADVDGEDKHSSLIKGYKRTFRNLARTWHANGRITEEQSSEIVALAASNSWKMWRPMLYVIPRYPIEAAGRLLSVPHRNRAALGPELQIADLHRDEFDIIEIR